MAVLADMVAVLVVALVVFLLVQVISRMLRPADPGRPPDVERPGGGPDAGQEDGDGDRLVTLRSSYSPGEADLIRGLLHSSGIRAMVSTDSADGWRPEALWRPARVLVRAADLGQARALLDAAQTPDADWPADPGPAG